ncbi:MAG: 1,6-anhydro-N-acetylmuramyl-L-alanine amidase AmpD [Zetaproteobacteria bacterium]|nr:1,6-anhydro-N-acetylmuramyl-L-alanine amidase AmpD [Zetaproteobacteria bacterium]
MAYRYSPSPFYNERPQNTTPDLIVIHAISIPDGEFHSDYIESLFLGTITQHNLSCNKELANLEVSSHFVIDRQGNITQFVPLRMRAWHAGESSWQGRSNCNDYSIGIELIGDQRTPFTSKQYSSLTQLCQQLMHHFPQITQERIVGHQEIAPTRKWDPGVQFDWHLLRKMINHIHETPQSPIDAESWV